MNREQIETALTDGKWLYIELKVPGFHEYHTYHMINDLIIDRTYATHGDDTASFGQIDVCIGSMEEILYILQLDNCTMREILIKDTKEELYDRLTPTFEFIRDLADPRKW